MVGVRDAQGVERPGQVVHPGPGLLRLLRLPPGGRGSALARHVTRVLRSRPRLRSAEEHARLRAHRVHRNRAAAALAGTPDRWVVNITGAWAPMGQDGRLFCLPPPRTLSSARARRTPMAFHQTGLLWVSDGDVFKEYVYHLLEFIEYLRSKRRDHYLGFSCNRPVLMFTAAARVFTNPRPWPCYHTLLTFMSMFLR